MRTTREPFAEAALGRKPPPCVLCDQEDDKLYGGGGVGMQGGAGEGREGEGYLRSICSSQALLAAAADHLLQSSKQPGVEAVVYGRGRRGANERTPGEPPREARPFSAGAGTGGH